jgi:hypothetical protein
MGGKQMSKRSLLNRLLAVSLAGTMVLGMTACGSLRHDEQELGIQWN